MTCSTRRFAEMKVWPFGDLKTNSSGYLPAMFGRIASMTIGDRAMVRLDCLALGGPGLKVLSAWCFRARRTRKVGTGLANGSMSRT